MFNPELQTNWRVVTNQRLKYLGQLYIGRNGITVYRKWVVGWGGFQAFQNQRNGRRVFDSIIYSCSHVVYINVNMYAELMKWQQMKST